MITDARFEKLLSTVSGGGRLSRNSENDLLREVENYLGKNPHEEAVRRAKRFDAFSDAENISWFIEEVEKRYAAGLGFSFLRMGDGEGRFVGELRHSPAINEFSSSLSKKIWFNYSSTLPESSFYDELELSYKNATCVGFSPELRLNMELERLWYGYLGVANGNKFLCNSSGRLVKAWLGKLLFDTPQFRKFFLNKKIVVISCHDAESHFSQLLGVDEVELKLIPPQGHPKLRDLTSGKCMYPNVFNSLRDDISRIGQAVYVIGAGVYSKILAEDARLSGGVAFDFGSMLDYMVGIETRN